MNYKRVGTAALVGSVFLVGCTKDLRPPGIGDSASAPGVARGRLLLQQAVQAHGGLKLWRTKETTTALLRDTWVGFLGRFANPWPEASTALSMQYVNGTLSARAQFLEGSRAGSAWGRTDDGRTYLVDRGGKRLPTENKDARFILAALQYLNELPFRLSLEATQITYVDRVRLNGGTYDRVLATWGSNLRPNTNHDQYMLYINTETKRLAKAHYTVRDFARFAAGCMHFDDYRAVDGLVLSFLQTVTNDCEQPGYVSDYLHQVVVSSVRFDEFKPEALRASPVSALRSGR